MRNTFKLLTAAAFLLIAAPSSASTFLAMSEQDLVRKSQFVVKGTVTEVNSSWNKDGSIIITEAAVDVDERWMGAGPDKLTVQTFGGQVGDFIVEAHGFPEFVPGEQAILFLYKEPLDGSFRVLGYQQGQYRVVTRLDGVTLAVPMVDEDVPLFGPDGRPGAMPSSIEIDAFKKRIKDAAIKAGRHDVY
ncbi:MAG: hypothetical protein ACU84H_11885 [Gammaproteobacteria bacterium]